MQIYIEFNLGYVKIPISTKTETDLITTLVATSAVQHICILFASVRLGRIK